MFVLGLGFLLKGADTFVEAASRIAKKMGVSDFIIGLTLTALGTSIPELASSISASIEEYHGLVIGNIVGSNIANIGLVLGICAFIGTFRTGKRMYQRDGYVMMLCVILLFILTQDKVLGRVEAVIFLFIYFVYIMFLVKTNSPRAKKYKFHDFIEYMFNFRYVTSIRSAVVRRAMNKQPSQRTTTDHKILQMFKEGLIKDILISLLSIVAIVFGSKYLVDGAIEVAVLLSVQENIIGLSLIAVGTSMPELLISINAVRKGYGTMVVGNVLGSNIANILLISSVSSLISPLRLTQMSFLYTIPILGFFSLVLLYFIKSNWKIGKKEGVIALSSYIIFIIYAFYSGWS